MLGNIPLVSMSDKRLGGIENSSLRYLSATRALEFCTATLSVRQCREQPPLWRLVRVRQVSNEIGPRMRQRLGLSQTGGNNFELGRAVRFEYHPKQHERAQCNNARDDCWVADLGREAAKQRKLTRRSAAAMSAELSVGEFQTRLFRDFKKGRADGLDDGPSLGHMRETTEAEVVGHSNSSVERGCESEAGTRIFAQAKGRRNPQPDLRISRGFGEVINVSDQLEPRARSGPRVGMVYSRGQSAATSLCTTLASPNELGCASGGTH